MADRKDRRREAGDLSGISETQRTILALTASALFQAPVSIPKETDWRAVFEEAAQQSILPIIFTAAEPYLPAADLPEWRRRSGHTLAKNMRTEWEHIELHGLMTARDIPYVVLKGSASAAYYPEPLLRIMGDVDFLVPPAELKKAGRALESAGFALIENREHTFHAVYSRTMARCPTSTWEMHWAPTGLPDNAAGEIIRELLSDVLERAELHSTPGGSYRVPSAFHHGLILLLHTAGHMTSTGIGLRHLCDWAVFENSLSDETFTDLFEEKLRAAGLWQFARILTAVSAKYLGCRKRPWAAGIEDELLESVLLDIFTGGNFGRKDPERINEGKLITNRSRGTVDDTGFFRQLCYSMNDKVRIALPAVKRHPALLPAGWAYVGGRHLLRMMAGKRPKIHVDKMVRGAAERKKIYRSFRLFEPE